MGCACCDVLYSVSLLECGSIDICKEPTTCDDEFKVGHIFCSYAIAQL